MVRTDYPDGGHRYAVVVEADAEQKPLPPFCSEGVERCPFDYSRIKRNLDNERRKVARSRRSVEDYCRCNALDHLLTLTAGKHLKTRDGALGAWSAFLDDKRFGRWFRDVLGGVYVAVAEPFEDEDGWHVHVAIRGRIAPAHLERLKTTWTGYLLRRLRIPRPNCARRRWRVNVQPPKPGHTPRSLGIYLGKYCGKAFDSITDGLHRYRPGLGMLRPVVRSTRWLLSETALWKLLARYDRHHVLRHPVTGSCIGFAMERTPEEQAALTRHGPPSEVLDVDTFLARYGAVQLSLGE